MNVDFDEHFVLMKVVLMNLHFTYSQDPSPKLAMSFSVEIK